VSLSTLTTAEQEITSKETVEEDMKLNLIAAVFLLFAVYLVSGEEAGWFKECSMFFHGIQQTLCIIILTKTETQLRLSNFSNFIFVADPEDIPQELKELIRGKSNR